MTRLVVIADTHMPLRAKHLPDQVVDAIKEADAIVHLGDFTDLNLVEYLRSLGPLYAVHGNNDAPEVRAALPAERRLEVHGRRILLIHGDRGGRTAVTAARAGQRADVVLFGHSHRAYCEEQGGKLLFNPGSPTDRRWAPYRSFGIVEIDDEIHAHVVPVEQPC